MSLDKDKIFKMRDKIFDEVFDRTDTIIAENLSALFQTASHIVMRAAQVDFSTPEFEKREKAIKRATEWAAKKTDTSAEELMLILLGLAQLLIHQTMCTDEELEADREMARNMGNPYLDNKIIH